MKFNFILMLLGVGIGGYGGYFFHRKYRLPDNSAGERIGKMIHISEGLNGYLEKKVSVLKK